MSTMEAERQKPNYLPQPHPSVCARLCARVFVRPIQRRFGADDVISCIRAGLWLSDDIIDSSGEEEAEMLRTRRERRGGGAGERPEILPPHCASRTAARRYTNYHKGGVLNPLLNVSFPAELPRISNYPTKKSLSISRKPNI